MNITITSKRIVVADAKKRERAQSWWIARVNGVDQEFTGRSQAEAVGRALLHLIRWHEIEHDPARIEFTQGGAN